MIFKPSLEVPTNYMSYFWNVREAYFNEPHVEQSLIENCTLEANEAWKLT